VQKRPGVAEARVPDSLDSLLLARIQFGFTISLHIIFPAFSIGLASYLAVLQSLWLATGRAAYMALFQYWLKIFTITFAMGVVSGVVMSYQFGTNWSVFADKTGPVLGPPMAYEVLSAFFLEAGFLGIMVFGMNRVGTKLHFFATLMVAAGTLFSAFWILAANSWMNTPAGFAVNENGQFVATDWWAVIFNPSFPYRLVHMVLAAYLTTAFVVGAVGAFHLLRDRSSEPARVMLSMAMWMAALVAPVQAVVGDLHGLNTLEYQPAKIAAMEGHFETQRGAPLILFGMPDMAEETTKYAVSIPKLGSLILAHSLEGEIKGLKEWPPEDRPNAPIVFWSFRIMVGAGLLMIGLGLASLILRWRGRLYDARWFHGWTIAMGPAGFIALLAGWITTEVGRQPFTVYGLLRTADSVSPIGLPGVASSLVAFVGVYLLVFGVGIYYILRLMAKPPQERGKGVREDKPIRTAGITPTPVFERRPAGPGRSGSAR
jgi:cytochrome bd ubiquinol oxidase subunit I